MHNILPRLLAAAGLLVAAPVLALAALAIVLEDGRPVLFRQVRIGRHGRRFWLVKLRTMRQDGSGVGVTAAGDPRITRVGRLLRRYKLDELPQLWNVVRGEMALIGPRPEVPQFVDLSDETWKKVLCVRPGITDLATLVHRNEEDLLGKTADPERYYRELLLPAKLRLNLRYMAARSRRRDLKLLLLTFRYAFFPNGFDPQRVSRSLLPGESQ